MGIMVVTATTMVGGIITTFTETNKKAALIGGLFHFAFQRIGTGVR
jgi:hypothetical protein